MRKSFYFVLHITFDLIDAGFDAKYKLAFFQKSQQRFNPLVLRFITHVIFESFVRNRTTIFLHQMETQNKIRAPGEIYTHDPL